MTKILTMAFCPRCGAIYDPSKWTDIEMIDDVRFTSFNKNECGYGYFVKTDMPISMYDRMEFDIKMQLQRGDVSNFDPIVLARIEERTRKVWNNEDSVYVMMASDLAGHLFFEKYILPFGEFDPQNNIAMWHQYDQGEISEEEYIARGGRAAVDKTRNENRAYYKEAEKNLAPKPQQDNRPKCPICGSTDLSKITNLKKGIKAAIWGLWALGEMDKTWECNHCGSKF